MQATASFLPVVNQPHSGYISVPSFLDHVRNNFEMVKSLLSYLKSLLIHVFINSISILMHLKVWNKTLNWFRMLKNMFQSDVKHDKSDFTSKFTLKRTFSIQLQRWQRQPYGCALNNWHHCTFLSLSTLFLPLFFKRKFY